MKLVSRLAMAAVLTLGSATLVATPAAAQKKKEEKADAPKLSEEFRKPAAAAEEALKASRAAADAPTKGAKLQEAVTNQAAAEAVAKNDDEKYYANWLKLQIALDKKDQATQLVTLGALSENPRTPPEQRAQFGKIYNFLSGSAAIDAKKYPEAIAFLTKARELGSTEGDIPVLLANAYAATNKPAEAIAEVDKAIQSSKAAGRKPNRDWYKFAISRVHAGGDRAATASWLSRYIADYPTVQDWRWVVAVYLQGAAPGANAKLEKLDLYRLMRATNALADQRDYAEFAYQAKQAGVPWEAVSVIDEGRAKGKVPATDADTREIYNSSKQAVSVAGSIDAEAAKAAKGTGKDLWYPAEAYLASGSYEKALALYDSALQKGGLPADEVNLHRGIALARLGRKPEAKAAFETIKTGPYANLALLWATSVDFPPLT